MNMVSYMLMFEAMFVVVDMLVFLCMPVVDRVQMHFCMGMGLDMLMRSIVLVVDRVFVVDRV